MRAAAKAATQVIHQGIPVGAVELLDNVQMGVINKMGGTGREWKKLPTLFFKFSGTKVGVDDNIQAVRRIVDQNGGSDFEFEQDKAKQATLWSARKEALWSMLCMRKSGNEVWSTDVAVPLSRVPDLVGKLYPPELKTKTKKRFSHCPQISLNETWTTLGCLAVCLDILGMGTSTKLFSSMGKGSEKKFPKRCMTWSTERLRWRGPVRYVPPPPLFLKKKLDQLQVY